MDRMDRNVPDGTNWTHDALAADLAREIRGRGQWLCFLNLEVGDCLGGPRRPEFPYFSQWMAEHGHDLETERGEHYREWHEAWDAHYRENPVGGRPDVFAVMNRGRADEQRTRVYEVKVGRPDFLSDVRAGKWRRYLYMAGSVVFAAPEGVIEVRDLPPGTGLMVRTERGWRLEKRAPTHHKGTLSPEQAFRVLRACHSQLAGDYWRKGEAV